MWDKYICANNQTVCILGVLILAAKLCKNDGHYSKKEEIEILSSIPHEKKDEKLLINILDDAGKDTKPIDFDAKMIKEKMGENVDLLEFIVATLYKLASSDHVYSESEKKDIEKIAKIFGIKESFSHKILKLLNIDKKLHA